MNVVPLTDEDVRSFCTNVDSEMREYCRERSGDAHWLENFMRNCNKEPQLVASPLPPEGLWQMIVGHLGRPTLH